MPVIKEIEDAKKVCAYARSLPYVDGVAIVGHSQGGVVASMTAGELGTDALRAVVLMAPAAVLRDDAIRGNTFGQTYSASLTPDVVELPGGLRLGKAYVQSAIRLPIYETAAKYQGPALVVHGTFDRIVPFTYGKRYHSVWPNSRLRLLPYYDHVFSQNIFLATEIVLDYLVETLK